MYFVELHCFTMYRITKYRITMYRITMYYIVIYCTVIHCIIMYCIALHCLKCVALQWIHSWRRWHLRPVRTMGDLGSPARWPFFICACTRSSWSSWSPARWQFFICACTRSSGSSPWSWWIFALHCKIPNSNKGQMNQDRTSSWPQWSRLDLYTKVLI